MDKKKTIKVAAPPNIIKINSKYNPLQFKTPIHEISDKDMTKIILPSSPTPKKSTYTPKKSSSSSDVSFTSSPSTEVISLPSKEAANCSISDEPFSPISFSTTQKTKSIPHQNKIIYQDIKTNTLHFFQFRKFTY